VTAHAAVGVDDDLPAGQASVGVGATGVGEAAGSVDDDVAVVVEQLSGNGVMDDLLRDGFDHVGVLLGFRTVELVLEGSVVLNGHDDGVNTGDVAVSVVLHGDLGLAVGASPWKNPLLTHGGQAAGQTLGERSRQREVAPFEAFVGFGFGASVAEHDALVACALRHTRAVYALSDVGGLRGDVNLNLAQLGGRSIHANGVAVVTDLNGGLTGHGFVVGHGTVEGHLTGEHDDALIGLAFDTGLHGNAGVGVHRQAGVDDGVGDGVAQFVGVTAGHGLGTEQVVHAPGAVLRT